MRILVFTPESIRPVPSFRHASNLRLTSDRNESAKSASSVDYHCDCAVYFLSDPPKYSSIVADASDWLDQIDAVSLDSLGSTGLTIDI